MPSLDSNLQQRLEERYKLLFTRITAAVFFFAAFSLLFSHWDTGNDRALSGIIILCASTSIYILLLYVIKDIPTPWGRIPARSEIFDTIRWCFNLPIDLYIVWSLDMHEASAVTVWVLLTFGALTEVHRPRNKFITTGVAIVSFCVLILCLYPTDLRTELFLIVCYLGLTFILWKLERYVAEEMAAVFAERLQRERMEREAEGLQREAAIGHSTRAINHELNTLIGVAGLSTERIRKQQTTSGDTNQDLERLEKSLSYMRKVSQLVLDDLGSEKAVKRGISLAELQDDLRLLLCNGVTHYQTRLEFDFPANASDYWFEERTGSTYLILHNLAKNAYEAVLEKFGDQPGGLIRISAQVEGEQLALSVYDNGAGIPESQLANIHQQLMDTSKINGHGFGLRFVQRECRRNNFKLDIESSTNLHSKFHILLPHHTTNPLPSSPNSMTRENQ